MGNGKSPKTKCTLFFEPSIYQNFTDLKGICISKPFHCQFLSPLSQIVCFFPCIDVGWVHENTHVVVKPGDEVHYWINVIQNGLGYLLTDQIWIVPGEAPCFCTLATPIDI